MSFENVQRGRVMTAVAIIFAVGVLISLVVQFGFVMVRLWGTLSELDPNATRAEQEAVLQKQVDDLLEETQRGSPTVRALALTQWALTSVGAFVVGWRTARAYAETPEQGVGYGLQIGVGAVLLYGLCICTTPTEALIKLIFFVILFVATVLGGQIGGQNPQPRRAAPAAWGRPPGPRRAAPLGGSPEAFYNMGVQAALGGRREEARGHFTRVLQLQPRHVAAWLQLANLAQDPDQAWSYVQQARSIDPSDPAVLRAVDVIWPQVAAHADPSAPHLQPPFPGGAQDDAAIPRSRLPRPPSAEALDAAFDEADTPILPGTPEDDEPGPPKTPPPAS